VIDPAGNRRVFDEWWGMVRFDSRVEQKRALAAPMFVNSEAANSMQV
jgi:hypothetical protein